MSKWAWKIIENPEPDPVVDAWLDYMSELGKIADTYAFYIGPAQHEAAPSPHPEA